MPDIWTKRILCYSYCAFSYIQYINQHMRSIKYNKIQIIKHVRVNTFHELYFMICTLLYFTECMCWFIYWILNRKHFNWTFLELNVGSVLLELSWTVTETWIILRITMNSLTTLRYSECDIDDKMKATMVCFRVCPRFVWGTERNHTNQ
jgi:hypothetical protein